MLRKIGFFILIVGAAVWLAQPGNGKQAGDTGGDMAQVGVDAAGGFFDGVSAFFNGLAK